MSDQSELDLGTSPADLLDGRRLEEQDGFDEVTDEDLAPEGDPESDCTGEDPDEV